MSRLLRQRLVAGIAILVGTTFVAFLLVALTGDPLGPLKYSSPPAPPEVIHAEALRLHLNEPIIQRYWSWIGGVIHGDFGPSVRTGYDIGGNLLDSWLTTIRLVAVAALLALVMALVSGSYSAVRQYSKADYLLTLLGFLFLAMPSFWFAILLKQGAISVNDFLGSRVFSTLGSSSIDVEGGFWAHLGDIFGHLVLPVISLSLISYAAWSRYQRSAMLDVLNSDYVRFARSKGISRSRVLIRHAFRTAMIPITTIVAVDFSILISGAVVIEIVFQWRGLGNFLIEAIRARDLYAVAAWMLISAVTVVVFNLLADLMYGILDPRIRGGRR